MGRSDEVGVLRLLAKRNNDLGRARNRTACRLHALLGELVAGGIPKESTLLAPSACSAASGPLPLSRPLVMPSPMSTSMTCAASTPDEGVEASHRRCCRGRQDLPHRAVGVGPVVAAMLIGYTGDVRRLPTRHHYAAYNGTAPIEVSSGGRVVHRLSRRGNRQLNHAIHIAAVTQIRFSHSEGRAFFERKVAEGKTNKEALRALKRRISDAVYHQFLLDAERTS